MIPACSVVYGGALVVAGLPSSWRWGYLALVFVVMIAAGAIMTLFGLPILLVVPVVWRLMQAECRAEAP